MQQPAAMDRSDVMETSTMESKGKRSAMSEGIDRNNKCSQIKNLHPQVSEVLESTFAEDQCGKLLEVLSSTSSDEIIKNTLTLSPLKPVFMCRMP